MTNFRRILCQPLSNLAIEESLYRIAEQISNGQLQVGKKIHARSTLATNMAYLQKLLVGQLVF